MEEGQRLPIAVVILTLDEELNLPHALESVLPWAGQVFVVDSFSTDGTVVAAGRGPGVEVVQHAFEGFPQQRNWALDNLPFLNEWVLFLDADERVSPELVAELRQLFADSHRLETVAGFYVKRRLLFMGRWIRRGGYYPVWFLRLFRRSLGRCEERSVNEHFVVRGATVRLRHDLVHEDHRDLTHWIAKHNRYATLEAQEMLRASGDEGRAQAPASLRGSQPERKRWLRKNLYERLPPLLRPFLYFLYRYVLRLGFLDRRPGLIYHVLQGFWFLFLVDAKYVEMRRHARASKDPERVAP